ncbi:hypothetical protein [Treponema rectale]|nr:hypothetical protein [Treponema rectale]
MIPFTLQNKNKQVDLDLSDYPLFYCEYDDDKKKKIEQGIIDKVKSTYRVDIQEVYNLPLPDLFKFIIDNIKS